MLLWIASLQFRFIQLVKFGRKGLTSSKLLTDKKIQANDVLRQGIVLQKKEEKKVLKIQPVER